MNKKQIEAELQKELEALIQAFGAGRELTIVYDPRDRIENFYGDQRYCGGEFREDTNELVIHRKTLNDAIETLVHEYMEAMLEPLYGNHVDSFNIIVPEIMKAYGKAFSKRQYKTKEKLINVMVRLWLKKRKEK